MTYNKETIFQKSLSSFLRINEEDGGGNGGGDGGGSPMTVASTGVPDSGEDAFISKTWNPNLIKGVSPLEGGTKGYFYDRKKKKKRKGTPKSFMDFMLEAKDDDTPMDFGQSFSANIIKDAIGENVYGVGDKSYTIKFYRKNGQNGVGKMFFIGEDGFAIRFNKLKNSKNEIDSISFWNKWRSTINEEDLNFSITPDADLITEGLSREKCFELAHEVFKNRNPKSLILKNIDVEKNGKKANKEFEEELKENDKTEISYTELLDFAKEKGYNVVEPGDGSLDIKILVPMKIPEQEYIIPHNVEYNKVKAGENLVKNNKLLLTAVNIQTFVKNASYAEEILQFFDSLFKDGLINNLTFESVLFVSKIRESNQPNWINLVTPKM